MDLRLFRDRSYSLGALLGLVYFAGFTTIFFIFTLFLQNGMGYTALQAGLTLTPFAVGSAISSAIGGRFITRVGRPLIAVGLGLVLTGLAGAALAVHEVQNSGVGWALTGPMLWAGLGSGLVISPNQTLALRSVPVAQGGAAGGVIQTGQRIGSAAGIAAVGAVFFARLAGSRNWATALDYGLLTAVCFVAAALVVAVADVLYAAARRAPGGVRENVRCARPCVRSAPPHPSLETEPCQPPPAACPRASPATRPSSVSWPPSRLWSPSPTGAGSVSCGYCWRA